VALENRTGMVSRECDAATSFVQMVDSIAALDFASPRRLARFLLFNVRLGGRPQISI